ncbi:uncharacterized protein LOC111133019 isoform X2 [Crassostrea virginica]
MRVLSPLKPRPHSIQAPSTVVSTAPIRGGKITKAERDVSRALNYLRMRQYLRGLRLLLDTRSGAVKALSTLVRDTVQEEMNTFLRREESAFASHKSLKDWSHFEWKDLLEETKESCPLLSACLIGASTSKKTLEKVSLRGRPQVSAVPTIGTIMSILAYQTSPKKMANLQELNGLQMWLASCKRQLFARFQHLGLCVGIHGTLNTVDRIRQNFDATVFKWRNTAADHLLIPSDESTADTIPYADDSSTPMSVDTPAHSPSRQPLEMTADSSRPIIPPQSDSDEPSSLSTLPSGYSSASSGVHGKPCYSICFDNVNQKTTVRHQTRDKKNKMFNMVQAYAALDRINSLHLSDDSPSPEDVESIPLHKLLPCEMDEVDLRSQMTVIVERILCTHIPFFEDVKDNIIWHIPDQYSNESAQKSEMVLLGVMDKDESKIGDAIDIVDEYHKYVPLKPDGSPLTLPLHADRLSCERVNDAQNARINGNTKWLQLQGLFPNIQEWHKRCLLLQDIYDELYSGKSSREVGTLFHLKNYFEHRNVTGNVKESFNYNEDFLEFCTEGYITLLALHILEMDSLQDIPDTEDKLMCLHTTASKIIDQVFQSAMPTVQNILRVDASDVQDTNYPYCVCRTEQPGAIMVFCDNRNCPKGVWFHIDCLNMDEEDIPEGVWYCSTTCEEEKAKRKSQRKMTTANTLADLKLDYALLLIWKGLSQMSRKDVLRENNGKMIITHWKFDLLQFFSKHHPKYFLMSTRLLLAVNGSVSPRLQKCLVWNRTVNVNGGIGHNIEMDLQMEYFNKEYKESVKDAAGHLTPATVARHSQMIGIGKDVRKIYDISVSGMSGRTIHKSGAADRSKDIIEFVNILMPLNIFTPQTGRRHKSFPDLDLNVYSKVLPKNVHSRLERIRKEESKKLQRRNRMLD